MASTKNTVIAGDYAKKKISYKTTWSGKKVVIQAGIIKLVPLDKKTVESYEVIEEDSRTSATSAIGRAAVGSFFLGDVGLAAALSAKKKKTRLVAVQFKDGRRSLLAVEDKIYKAIMTTLF